MRRPTLGACGTPGDLPPAGQGSPRQPTSTRASEAAEAIVRITNRLLEQDTDGDGIPDSVERELGTPRRQCGEAGPLPHTANTKGPGTTRPRSPAAGVDRSMVRARGRTAICMGLRVLLGRLRDAHDISTVIAGSTETTPPAARAARPQGVDVMYSFVDARNDPRIFTHELRVRKGWPVRGLVARQRIYVCDDIRVQQADGKARAKIHLLSERYPNGRTRDQGREGHQAGGGARAPCAPRVPCQSSPSPRPVGFQTIPPSYAARLALRYDKGNVPLAITESEGKGFERHYDGYVQSDQRSAGGDDHRRAHRRPLPAGVPRPGRRGRRRRALRDLRREAGRQHCRREIGRTGNPLRLPRTASAQGRQNRHPRLRARRPRPLRRLHARKARSGHSAPGRGESLFGRASRPSRRVSGPGGPRLDHQRDRLLPGATRGKRPHPVPRAPPRDRASTIAFSSPPPSRCKACKATIVAKTDDQNATATTAVAAVRPNPGSRARRPGEVALTVVEPTSKGRLGWPVTSGVPFAPGVLAKR